MNFAGAKAAWKAYREATGNDVVSETEILRRYKICEQCPMRRKSANFTSTISKALGKLANRFRVPEKIGKQHCGACRCSFMLMLPSKTYHQDTPDEATFREEANKKLAKKGLRCWVTKGIEAQEGGSEASEAGA